MRYINTKLQSNAQQLIMENRNGEFTRKNTLSSQQTPKFAQRQQRQVTPEQQQSFDDLLRSSTTGTPPHELPHLRRLSTQTPSPPLFKGAYYSPGDSSTGSSNPSPLRQSDSQIGNSSSLFDHSSPAVFVFSGNTKAFTMVNERSPAQAPSNPNPPNNLSTQQTVKSVRPVQATDAPRFGQPTLPQSPMSKSALENKLAFRPVRPDYPKPQPANSMIAHTVRILKS